jgi:hypothetical protein
MTLGQVNLCGDEYKLYEKSAKLNEVKKRTIDVQFDEYSNDPQLELQRILNHY